MVSRDSVFPPPASGLASWAPKCPDETPHFNGFLAPEYASQPTPYLHESRHLHALKRARGSGGRFLNTKKLHEPSNSLCGGGNVNGSRSSSDHNKVFQNTPFRFSGYPINTPWSQLSCQGLETSDKNLAPAIWEVILGYKIVNAFRTLFTSSTISNLL